MTGRLPIEGLKAVKRVTSNKIIDEERNPKGSMISDTLFEAAEELNRYIVDPAFTYDESAKNDVRWLLDRMKELQNFLDDPTGEVEQPCFEHKFEVTGQANEI